MNRRQKIIISITGIFIVMLALVGLTYGYYLTKILGNENNKSISLTTANLELVYGDDDGSIIGENEKIIPNKTFESKTFTVTNNGNKTIDSYAVVIDNLSIVYATDSNKNKAGDITSLESTTIGEDNDFKLIITCKNQQNEECQGYEGALPEKNSILFTNSIDVNDKHTYTATLTYVDTGKDQSKDMNKKINGRFNIIDMNSTIDLEGTVEEYEKGDYVQTNSVKRTSVIYSDGTYKILGLEVGTHKIKICSASDIICSDETAKLSKTITINKGSYGIIDNSNKTITSTENIRIADINITKDDIDIVGLSQNIDTAEQGFVYQILRNSGYTQNDYLSLGNEQVVSETDFFSNEILISSSDNIEILSKILSNDESAKTFLTNCLNEETLEPTNNEGCGDFRVTMPAMNSNNVCDDFKNKYVLTSNNMKINYVSDCVDNNVKLLELSQVSISIEKHENDYYVTKKSDNYVNFAGMCWQIIKINSDNTIKLLLEDQDNTCETSNGNWNIPTSDGNAVVGPYGYTGTSIRKNTQEDSTLYCPYDYSICYHYIYNFRNEYLNPDSKDSMAYAFEKFQKNNLKNSLDYLVSGNWNNMNHFYDNEPMFVGTLTKEEAEYISNVIINDYQKNKRLSFWTLTEGENFVQKYFDWDPYTYLSANVGTSYIFSYDGILSNDLLNISDDEYYAGANASFRPAVNLKNLKGISGTGSKLDPYKVG